MSSRRPVTGLAVAMALLALAAAPATAQAIRIVGAVQWISAEKLQVMTEGGSSLAVDLMEADQSSYRGLRPGDWVLIDGVVSSDRRKVIALNIWRDSGRGAWTQSP